MAQRRRADFEFLPHPNNKAATEGAEYADIIHRNSVNLMYSVAGFLGLRVRAKISWHFGASAGRADARHRDAGDVVTSSRSGNAADARPPPRPAGLPDPRLAISYVAFSQDAQAWETAAKCQVIFARALSPRSHVKSGNSRDIPLSVRPGDITDRCRHHSRKAQAEQLHDFLARLSDSPASIQQG